MAIPSFIHWRKYGEACSIPFSLHDATDQISPIIGAGWTPIAGDVVISKSADGTTWTNFGNATNLPTASGNSSPLWQLTLTTAETAYKQVSVLVYDTASIGAVHIAVVTFGHASAMYPFDLSSATAGSGISVSPIQSNVATSLMVETDIEVYQTSESPSLIFTVLDTNNAPIDLSAATLAFKVYDRTDTVLFTRTTGGSGITVGGSSSNLVTVTYTAANTATAGAYKYSLWRTEGNDTLLATGDFIIKPMVK